MHPGRARQVARPDNTEKPQLAGAADQRTAMMLQERIDALELEKQAVERFARIAAHELMEPLVVAEACAMLLADELGNSLAEKARADLENLLRGASRMRLIVETLLHDARCSGQPIRRTPVDLGELARTGIALLHHEIRAHNATVDVGPLPLVQGDALLLDGVLKNLLMNAVRYGPREGGVVTLRARRIRAGWRIAVSSQGITVAPEDRVRIFDPFYRGEHERPVRGTGLGLAICRSNVDRHGGSIGVQPMRPRGNRFVFTLPD